MVLFSTFITLLLQKRRYFLFQPYLVTMLPVNDMGHKMAHSACAGQEHWHISAVVWVYIFINTVRDGIYKYND